MLSRHYLRAKALQSLYACTTERQTDNDTSSEESVSTEHNPKYTPFYTTAAADEFHRSIQSLNDLGILQLSVLPEFLHVAEIAIEEASHKFNPTQMERLSSRRLPENSFILRLADNYSYRKYVEKLHIDWSTVSNTLRKLYNTLKTKPLYQQYLETENSGYNADKEMALELFRFLLSDDAVRHFIYERGLLWEDDFDQISQYNYMMLKTLTEDTFNESTPFPIMFDKTKEKDSDDFDFARQLLVDTLTHMDENETIIREHLQNWDFERVATIDLLLINMAITEFTCCSSIAEKVTVNEYIELAKEFSTDKSSIFVNGILDKILIDLRREGKVVKTGRGLIDFSENDEFNDISTEFAYSTETES
ncbi:MAG: transcription antitermination factor NusB [Bacteroidales bacterium]|nr:transcription antitermination factor NusB [Bacteroidales bacterium]